jgi:putative transposase
MARKNFSEEQIIGVLKRADAGAKTVDLCRELGITTTTFYRWKAKYGGMDISEARRLKTLEAENSKLKHMLADSMLDNKALKELLSKNW